jgi:hypothetical protein
VDEQPNPGSFVRGLGLTLALNLLVAVVLCFGILGTDGTGNLPLSTITFYSFRYIGALQILYVLPFWIRSRRKGESDTANGIVVAACVTVLLNGLCNVILRIS